MFQFVNTIIVNSAVDAISGLPKFSAIAAAPPKPAAFEVKRVNTFYALDGDKGGVVHVYKRNAAAGILPSATFSAAGLTPGVYQLAVNILLSQYSQNSFYSRAIPVVKGKPLYFGFEVVAGDTDAQIAAKIAGAVNQLRIRFGDDWIRATVTGTNVTITGTDEFQRIKGVYIEKFVPLDSPCACSDVCNCGWEKQDVTATITQGRDGFGTFNWILRNLRLPTVANTSWVSPNADERPIPGVLYDQYVVQYVMRRGIQGVGAVGELTKSATEHVFYVRQDLVPAFETALAGVAAATAAGAIEVVTGPGAYPAPTAVVGA